MSRLSVFRVSSSPLAISDVVSLLKKKPPEDRVSTLPPVKPKAGEIYLYKSNTEEQKGSEDNCTNEVLVQC